MVPVSASVAKRSSPIDVKLPFLFQFGLDICILGDLYWAPFLFIYHYYYSYSFFM